MAHQKLGNGQNTEQETDIAVVAPSNMGAGLIWDVETSTYKVNINAQNARVGSGLEIGPNGAVNVALSKDSTNLLQMKPDGVYYGVKPPANLENLYVDALNGVDQHPDEVEGAGTSSKPLRTLRYASNLAVNGTARNIYLHTEQEHIVMPEHYFMIKSGQVNIYPYGPAFDQGRVISNGDLTGALAYIIENGKAPILKFTGMSVNVGPSNTKEYTYPSLLCFGASGNTTVNLYGIHLVNDLTQRLEKHIQATTDEVRGGTIGRIGNDAGSVWQLKHCKLSSTGEYSMFNASNKGSITYFKQIEGVNTYVGGFFRPEGGTLNFLNCSLSNDIKCHLIAHHGWDQPMSARLSVSLSSTNEKERFAKRIYGPIIDEQNGVKILLAPKSDISATLFV